nr:MAG TPA: hypothetical protein [Caudoviricetes sp.]
MHVGLSRSAHGDLSGSRDSQPSRDTALRRAADYRERLRLRPYPRR